jgi:hypothetical protein
MEIPTVHAAFNQENHLIVTFWLWYWSLKGKANIFAIEESNPYSKQYNKTGCGIQPTANH